MKRILMTILLAAVFLIFSSSQSYAITLFFDNFEGGNLSQWHGKSGGVHSGVIVTDPLDPSGPNHVLTFEELTSSGDIFTKNSFDSEIDEFRLSFDYLGLYDGSGADPDNLGGSFGHGANPDIASGYTWYMTTLGELDRLPDSGDWEHVIISFNTADSIYLTLLDWEGSGGIAGDSYFDNICLENPPSSIPEPATIFLVGFGLLTAIGFGRKRYSKKI